MQRRIKQNPDRHTVLLESEICESSPYGRSSDVWSLGVVLLSYWHWTSLFKHHLYGFGLSYHHGSPSWDKIPNRYSKSILGLAKSMPRSSQKVDRALSRSSARSFSSHISLNCLVTLYETRMGALWTPTLVRSSS